MLLYPDQRVEQPDNGTVCFAAPIDMCDWEYLYSVGRYNVIDSTGMRYTILDDGIFMRGDHEIDDKVCILIRKLEDYDDCIESAAWVRIKENFPGMIYICRGSTTADQWQTHAAALGAPEEYVAMVDIEYKTEE